LTNRSLSRVWMCAARPRMLSMTFLCGGNCTSCRVRLIGVFSFHPIPAFQIPGSGTTKATQCTHFTIGFTAPCTPRKHCSKSTTNPSCESEKKQSRRTSVHGRRQTYHADEALTFPHGAGMRRSRGEGSARPFSAVGLLVASTTRRPRPRLCHQTGNFFIYYK
jgi:hypothetical protein